MIEDSGVHEPEECSAIPPSALSASLGGNVLVLWHALHAECTNARMRFEQIQDLGQAVEQMVVHGVPPCFHVGVPVATDAFRVCEESAAWLMFDRLHERIERRRLACVDVAAADVEPVIHAVAGESSFDRIERFDIVSIRDSDRANAREAVHALQELLDVGTPLVVRNGWEDMVEQVTCCEWMCARSHPVHERSIGS